MSATGPLSKTSVTVLGISITIPTLYKIKSTDSSTTRKAKAIAWVLDKQIASIMSNVKPLPDSSNAAVLRTGPYVNAVDSNNSTVGYKSYVQYMM